MRGSVSYVVWFALVGCGEGVRGIQEAASDVEPVAQLEEADTEGLGGVSRVRIADQEGLVRWTEVDGYAIRHGDVILGHADDLRGARGVVESDVGGLWPGGVVPYEIDPGLYDPGRVSRAITEWETKTSLRFVPRTTEADWVYFYPGSGCSSWVGRVGGRQTINLASGCSTGNTIHEIGHAIGLEHEQIRPDRDDHVEVVYDCIYSGSRFNYDTAWWQEAFGPYDWQSIMHYNFDGFLDRSQSEADGTPCGTTMRRWSDGTAPYSQRDQLSPGDVRAAESLYGTGPDRLQLWLPQQPVAGVAMDVFAYGADPGELVGLGGSLGGIAGPTCFGVLGGMCFDLDAPQLLQQVVADGDGRADFRILPPTGYDLTNLALQAAIRRGSDGADSVRSDAVEWVDPVDRACVDPDHIRDCDGHCVPEWWRGGGGCDDGRLMSWGQADFMCAEHGFDFGDC